MQKLLNKSIAICFIYLSVVFQANCQDFKTDIAYINNFSEIKNTTPLNKVTSKKSIPYKLLNGALTFYQRNISAQFSAQCLYETSCSRFSRLAIDEFGILKGLALTADRLSRCNRISATTISTFRINQQGKVIDYPQMYKNE